MNENDAWKFTTQITVCSNIVTSINTASGLVEKNVRNPCHYYDYSGSLGKKFSIFSSFGERILGFTFE